MRWNGIEYSVRENHRARRVILRVYTPKRLDVVVPRGFARRRLPEIFQTHLEWIQRELQRVQELPELSAPRDIDLNAIDERWRVVYPDEEETWSRTDEPARRVLAASKSASEIAAVTGDLTDWLHRKAHAHLVPWLRDVSREIGMPFQKTSIRGQTTRWASCSKLRNISLNRSLLFLPPHLVRHVFLHELCHIKRLDHSPTFWGHLQDLEPNYRALEAAVKDASRYVPSWVAMGKHR